MLIGFEEAWIDFSFRMFLNGPLFIGILTTAQNGNPQYVLKSDSIRSLGTCWLIPMITWKGGRRNVAFLLDEYYCQHLQRGAKCFRYRVSIHHPFNWHSFEGAGGWGFPIPNLGYHPMELYETLVCFFETAFMVKRPTGLFPPGGRSPSQGPSR